MKKIILANALWLLITIVQADGMQQFRRFIASSKTMRANFVQTVVTNGKTETAQGTLEVSRPGKFRWTYETPYQQIIIGCDKTLWIYDVALAQVTKKSMSGVMSPAYEMLLSGSNYLGRGYQLANDASTHNLEWIRATSKRMHHIFSSVRMGFRDNTLVEMELIDRFNQRMVLQFTQVSKNIAISKERFVPTYPRGVSILPTP